MTRLPSPVSLSFLPWLLVAATSCATSSGPSPYAARELAVAYAPAEEAPQPTSTQVSTSTLPPATAIAPATERASKPTASTTSDELPALASPDPQEDRRSDRRDRMPWEFTLAGTGSNDKDFKAGSGGVTATLGYFFNEIVEVGLRQNLTFADAEGVPSAINAATLGAIDLHLPLDRFYPFIGGNIGYIYGDSVKETFAAGPEGGVKFFLKEDIFVQAMVEYEFFFDKDESVSNAFDEGIFQYSLGLGMRF